MGTATPFGGPEKPATVGIPLPATDLKIVDPETGQKQLGPGEPGEICFKGPQVMKGYYKNPEETAKVLKDGWVYTGDIGYLDEDGFLTLVDRKKDMIIASGYNIYPNEIDEILYEHPQVAEACTIGVPDEYRGETVKSFIVLRQGGTVSEQEIIEHCKQKLAAYKVPKKVAFVESLPKSAVGKILRRKLRDQEKDQKG
jgi:long-chain acyl-CoA synthetase